MNVERAFSKVRDRVEATVAVPDSVQIVALGRRRRTRRVIVAGLAVIAVILGGYSLVRSPVAMPPTPAVSATPSPSPSYVRPTGSRTGSDRVPAGFLVHDENFENPAERLTVNSPCFGQPVMGMGSTHSVGEGAAEVRISQRVYVYADEAAAHEVMQGVRQRQVRSCIGFPDARVMRNDTPGLGDESIGQTVALPRDGAGEHTGEPVRMVIYRVGRTVVSFYGYPEIPEIQRDAQALIPRLCVYNPPGCTPPKGQPQAVSELTNGGQVWAAALDVYFDTDRKARPGAAIAAAAERGYIASIVRVECDQGAEEALHMPGSDARYVAIYFRSREEAESVRPARGVFSVRTWCL